MLLHGESDCKQDDWPRLGSSYQSVRPSACRWQAQRPPAWRIRLRAGWLAQTRIAFSSRPGRRHADVWPSALLHGESNLPTVWLTHSRIKSPDGTSPQLILLNALRKLYSQISTSRNRAPWLGFAAIASVQVRLRVQTQTTACDCPPPV
jgi:hypothetical protein